MNSRGIAPLALVGILLIAIAGIASEPPITAVAFTPEGKHVVGVSQSGIHVFNWPELDRSRTIPLSTPNLHCLAFSPDAKHLAVGGGAPSDYGRIEVLTWPQGEPAAKFNGHNDSVRSVTWQNNATLISGSVDRDLKLWNLNNEPITQTTLKGHSRSINAICLIENGRMLVSTGVDKSLRVWNLNTGALIRSLNQHTKTVNALSRRPTTSGLPMVASAAQDRTIRFWQPTIGRMVRYIRLESEPLNLAWTNDGTRILASCVDGHVRVIDPERVTVVQDIPCLEGWAYAIAMHPHDQSAAIGGTNGQIRRVTNLGKTSPGIKE